VTSPSAPRPAAADVGDVGDVADLTCRPPSSHKGFGTLRHNGIGDARGESPTRSGMSVSAWRPPPG
jgi:hypothetical protein